MLTIVLIGLALALILAVNSSAAPISGIEWSGSEYMTIPEIYRTALNAGFPSTTAAKMTAIALRESGGKTDAFYGGKTGTEEASYGLWQINMKNAPERLAAFNINSADELLNPDVNARAAFVLWAGNDANLARHWYIDRYGDPNQYAERYASNLQLVNQSLGVMVS